MVVHGDDFTILGAGSAVNWFKLEIKKRFEIKHRRCIGPSKDDSKSIRLLNRVFEWGNDGIRIEADQMHAEIIVRDLGASKKDQRACQHPEKRRKRSTWMS